MNRYQKAHLEALYRVQAYLNDHASVLGTVMESPSRAALDQAVSDLQTQAGKQSAAETYAVSQTAVKNKLREELRLHHMQPIAAIARGSLAGTPQINKLHLPPQNIDDAGLVQAADGMADAASLYSQVFIDHKLPADFIAQLQAAVAAVQGAMVTRRSALSQVTELTQSLKGQVTDAGNVVRILNALVVKQVKGSASLLKAWRTAKQINAKPGVPQGTTQAEATPTPPTGTAPGTSTSTPAVAPAEPGGAKAA